MLAGLLQPVRLIVDALCANDSSRQLAWGIAVGMFLGLLPKGNLTALVLAGLLFSLRINLGAGLVSATAFSWLGMLLDGPAHRLGWQILSQPSLQPAFVWCYSLPLVPWSGLNNTVVVGQLAFGLYALYPVYWLGFRCCDRWRDVVAERIVRHRVARTLLGIDVASRLELGE